jgi:hypothetical protein
MKKIILLTLSIFLATNSINAQEAKRELKPALLVIDVQNAYIPSMDQQDKDLAFEHINGAICMFNKFELTINRIYHLHLK